MSVAGVLWVYRAGAERFWSLCAPSGAKLESWRWTADGDYNDDDAYSGGGLNGRRFGCRGHGKEQSKSEANVPPIHAIPHQSNGP